jgi:hypothetical protein
MSFGIDVFSGWRHEAIHLQSDLALGASIRKCQIEDRSTVSVQNPRPIRGRYMRPTVSTQVTGITSFTGRWVRAEARRQGTLAPACLRQSCVVR